YSRTLPPPLHISQITFSGRVSPGEPLQENLAATATDGARIYFSQIEDGKTVLEQTLIADSESSPLNIPSEITSPSLGDISPDGSKLLVRDQHFPQMEQTLWIVPTLGGTARNFSTIPAHDGTWMPDWQRILYASGTALYTANEDGSNKQKFASLPDRAFWLRWSPDGSRLRFTLLNKLNHTASLWEISSTGKNLHPVLPNWSNPASECCGTWTADGKYYVFQSAHDGRNDLWALKEDSFLKGLWPPHPIQITNGPLSYQAPIAGRSGEQLFFVGLDTRTVLLRYEPQSAQFVPYGKELNSANLVTFSNDGSSVAWIRPEDSTLWRSHIDGTQRIQLTSRPMQVFMMHWSPDNKHIVLMGREPGKLWKLYLVDAQGGDLVPLLNESRNEADPGFSPDGNSLVFGRLPELMAEKSQPKSIYILNLKTKQITTLPHSEGYFSPRWSPDGKYIAAMTLGQNLLMLFDVKTSTWKTLAPLPARDPVWSPDSHWVYFHDFLADDQPIYRVSVPDGHMERVAGMKSLQPLDIVDFRFAGLAPGNIPLVSARLSTANIYNIDLAKK
ncbi:MAG: TolB family protein, partial [Acidobacteriaceae bacterium]